MPMPLLTGLVGEVPGADEGEPEAETVEAAPMTVADLTPDELEALQAEAEQAEADGLLDEAPMPVEADEAAAEGGPEQEVEAADESEETAADEAAESPETQAAEAASGEEMHSTTYFVEQTKAMAAECETLLDDLETAIDELSDSSVADDLLDQAIEAAKTAEDAAKIAEDALAEDNITMAASAAAQVEAVKQLLTDAISQVREAAKPVVLSLGKGAPAATGASAVPGAQAAKDESPLSTWASRTASGAKGCH